jgi:hypothetical protein
LGRDVANPEILEVDRLPVLLDQHDGARDLAGRDLVADVVADARKLFGREAGRSRNGSSVLPKLDRATTPAAIRSATAAATPQRCAKPSVLQRFIDELFEGRWTRWRSEGVCSSSTKSMSCLRSITM